MAGRQKHKERSRRSYRTNQSLMQAAARSSALKASIKQERKQRGSAIANLVAAAKNLVGHRTTEK